MEMVEEIKTKGLLLKVVHTDDVENVVNYIWRNREFLKEWEPLRNEDYYSVHFQENQVQAELKRMAVGLMHKFYIFKDRLIIGSISLNNIVRGAFQSCHLGYRLDQEEQGKGYMTVALKAIVDFAFHELELHRLEANIMPRNQASIRVVEKLGFVSEGISKNYLKINGRWEDHIHMVLLNEELERG